VTTSTDDDVLDGQGALVTGGGSGIGLAVARRLKDDGALVTICGRSKERLDAAVEELGDDVRTVVADVTVEDDVVAAVAAAADAPLGLRIAVANAGGSSQMGPLVATGLEEFRATVDVNVLGTFLTIKHAAPHLVRNGGGSIVAVSSIAAAVSHPYLGAYAVGKAGIDMLVKVAADELGRSKVRVNAVRPGLVDTELVAGIFATQDVLDSYLTQTPLGRAGEPGEIAELIRFLAGPESAWITGQAIGIDGGHSLRRGPDYTPFAEPVYGADALRGIPPSPT
jgi:NAD(P)-dependent dehydrogenase (short-subunit alcohol dehydrogenase family)